jgi:hypothetical protein
MFAVHGTSAHWEFVIRLVFQWRAAQKTQSKFVSRLQSHTFVRLRIGWYQMRDNLQDIAIGAFMLATGYAVICLYLSM